jgi:cytochrome c oxidase subunit 2
MITWKISELVDSLSTYSADIDGVFELIFWMVAFWTTLCFMAFFYLLWKYRARPGQKALYVAGESKEEKRWVTIPHFLVLICDVFIIIAAVRVWYDVKQDQPEVIDRQIRVIAQQWGWTFVDPGPDNEFDTDDDIVSVDDLYIQQGINYEYILTSRDVLHDFSVPVFRLKQDALPGREITGWFQATGNGAKGYMVNGGPDSDSVVNLDDGLPEHKVYDVQCAEMCGIGHGIMNARIHILDESQFETWKDYNNPLRDRTVQLAASE